MFYQILIDNINQLSTVSYFHLSLTLTDKVRVRPGAYPRVELLKGLTLTLNTNVRLRRNNGKKGRASKVKDRIRSQSPMYIVYRYSTA